MANEADAELVVSVDDRLTPSLSRMAAATKMYGNQIGASAGDIDKAVRKVTAAGADMAKNNGVETAMQRNRRAMAATKAELAKYRAEVTKLGRAATAVPSASSFSGFRDAKGKGISVAEMNAYNTALKNVSDTEAKLARIRSQGYKDANMRPAMPVGYTKFLENQARATAAAAAATQQLAAAGTAAEKVKWWPPAALKSTQAFTQSLMEAQNATRYVMYDVARNFALGGAAVLAFGVASVVMAARWEAAFASVERTTQGSEQSLERIRQGLIQMSQDLPVSFTQLTEIATLGAQMGIAADGIVAYTDVIAKLTATTNLTADAAGKALGRFKAFFATADDPSLAVTERTFANLASSILKVGVNSVATETGIVNVATQISSMGEYAGLTADQVIGLSGALSSVGVPPELSRGVITRLFNTISEAVAEGGSSLEAFSELAGVTSDEFAAAWGTDRFAYAFVNLIQGLNQVQEQGGDAVTTLHELGITSVRDVPVLLRLAGAADEAGRSGGLLAQTMNDARQGWRDNIELQLQYSKIAQTVAARAKVLVQNFEALFATMGAQSLGPIKLLLDGIIGLVKGMTIVADLPVVNALSSIAVVSAIALGAILLLTAGFVRAGAAAIGFGQTLQHLSVPLATATALTNGLRIALLGLGAIGILAAIVGSIVAFAAAADDAHNAISDTQGLLAAMKEDAAANGQAMRTFSANADAVASSSRGAATQADNLANVSNRLEDETYGAAAGTRDLANASQEAALKFGKASAEFVKSSLLQSQGFQDLFNTDNQDFVDQLTKGGFSLDRLIQEVARSGRQAGKAYIESFTGVKPNDNYLDAVFGGSTALNEADEQLAHLGGELLNFVDDSVGASGDIANAFLASGEAIGVSFSNAYDIAGQDLEDFKVQNEDAINSIAKGYEGFVQTGALIGFTQQFQQAIGTLDDASTDVNEHAEAVAGFERAWVDAYGGASFSIQEYMTVFRRAAEEQQTFMGNLTALAARGVPTTIISDLAAMGPDAAQLVQALVESTDKELQEYVNLYGTTGFDAMVAMAAGQLAAEQIVRNAARHLSTVELQQLAADLAKGDPLAPAMKKWNLDAQGNPLTVPAKTAMDYYAEQRKLQQRAAELGFSIPITPYLTQSRLIANPDGAGGVIVRSVTIGKNYDVGGYTGSGGKYDPAGIVHRGEYVHPKSDVDQRTGMPKPDALMRMLAGGRPARRGGGGAGYADGGFVSGTMGITHLSMEDRRLLMEIRDSIGISIAQSSLAASVNSANANDTRRRSA